MRDNYKNFGIIAIIFLLPFLFFWRLITPNTIDKRYIKEGDFTEQYFPLRAFTAREWVNGKVPLWNPHIFGGQPALADIQSGALYPPHILQALILGGYSSLSKGRGWGGVGFPLNALAWQMIFHFSIAGVGAYLLGKRLAHSLSLQQSMYIGVIVSLTFTYSGYLTGFPIQQITILQTSTWLPWLIWSLDKMYYHVLACEPLSNTISHAALSSIFFALAVLAGHPQTMMYLVYLSLAFTLFKMYHAPNNMGILPVLWITTFSLGMILSAAQLLPTIEFIRHSLRSNLAFEDVAQGLPFAETIGMLYPGYLGGSPQYIGILPMVLIAVAIFMGRGRMRQAIHFWSGVGLIGLILSWGGNTFLYPLFYLLIPGFGMVRQQERAFLLYAFACAILTGYGTLILSQPIPKKYRDTWQSFQRYLQRIGWVAVAMTGLFIYGAVSANVHGQVNLFNGVLRHHIFGLILFGGGLLLIKLRPIRLWRRWWGMILVSFWLGLNLFTINWQFHLEKRDNSSPYISNGISQFLLSKQALMLQPFRIDSNGLLAGGNNAAIMYGLEDVTGNSPLQLANVADFTEKMSTWRYWQLMNVRYVLDTRDIDSAGLVRRYEMDDVKIYEVMDAFPRARMVHDVIFDDDILVLAHDETDLKKTALLQLDMANTKNLANLQDLPGLSTVTITENHAGYLAVTVETDTDGLLVFSNIDYPGWHAELNGMPADIYRTNGIFQGVFIPQGKHSIVIMYSISLNNLQNMCCLRDSLF